MNLITTLALVALAGAPALTLAKPIVIGGSGLRSSTKKATAAAAIEARNHVLVASDQPNVLAARKLGAESALLASSSRQLYATATAQAAS